MHAPAIDSTCGDHDDDGDDDDADDDNEDDGDR